MRESRNPVIKAIHIYVSVVSQWERIYSFSPSIQSDSAIDVCDALRGPSKHIPAEIETAREEWRPSMAE